MNRRLGVSLTVLAAVWLWLVTVYIPEVGTEGEPGPRAFPFILGIILAVLGVALAFQPGPKRSAPQSSRETSMAISTVALLIAYAFLLDKAGFIVSTIALVVVAMTGILGMRRWLLMGSLAVVFTLACWVVFVSVLGVPLPGGSWMQ